MAGRADKSVMDAPSDKPIRLTERQTELLTQALAEATEQGPTSKSTETQMIRNPSVKPPNLGSKGPQKPTVI